LQLNDRFITLIEPSSEANHDISLLKEQVLISVYLNFVIFQLLSFFLKLIKFDFVLLPNDSLLGLEGILELRSVFDLLASYKHLGSHHLDFLIKHLLSCLLSF